MAMRVKRNDTVVILSGKDQGHRGKVMGTLPKEGKVVVEGLNMMTVHVKSRAQGQEGGIFQREAAIAACKVQVVCPKCDKPTRVGYGFKEEDGKKVKVRLCKHCGAEL